MEIKEKLSTKIIKDGETYFLYGPQLSAKEIDQCWKKGQDCYLLKMPIEKATPSDVIECVDPIKVWFSDFQIYKHILRKMYGEEKFAILTNLRWNFLELNQNRFQLIFAKVGDYGLSFSEFEVLCFDKVKSEYIHLNLEENKYVIRRFNSNTEDKAKLLEEARSLDSEENLVESNPITCSHGILHYELNHKEYQPLVALHEFLNSFYFYFLVDGNLISWFEPLQKNN